MIFRKVNFGISYAVGTAMWIKPGVSEIELQNGELPEQGWEEAKRRIEEWVQATYPGAQIGEPEAERVIQVDRGPKTPAKMFAGPDIIEKWESASTELKRALESIYDIPY